MNTDTHPADGQRLPIPSGWYMACPSTQLPAGGQLLLRVCGRRLRLWRGPDGRARGEVVQQGWHPEREVQEQDGMVLVWHHPHDRAPGWRVRPLEEGPWSPMRFRSVETTAHPLHVMQDLADLPHFEGVHGYDKVRTPRPLEVDAQRLRLEVDFGWDMGIPGVKRSLPASFDAKVEGPGFQVTDVRLPTGLVRSRHLVLPTPIDAHRTRLHMGLSVRLASVTGLPSTPAGRLGRAGLRRGFLSFIFAMFERDLGRDMAMWVRRPHTQPRHMSPDEALFADWTRQFTPTPSETAWA